VTIPETLLTFVGAPAGIIAVIALAVLGPGQMRTSSRYRPGRPWPYEPAWYVPRPEGAAASTARASEHAHENGAHLPAIAASDHARDHATGGASGEW
jgi:hypothetical protein